MNLKFAFVVCLSAAFALSLSVAPNASAFSGSGSGTSGDPYIITTVAQLQEMNNNLSAHYALGNDIDATITNTWNGGLGFQPIGWIGEEEGYPFMGGLDGRGHTIENLYINRPSESGIGLFGFKLGGRVTNVGLKNADMLGYAHVGGIAGWYQYGTIDNCYATGSISGDYNIGGLVGYFITATMSNCWSSCDATCMVYYVGGLVGRTWYGTITNCYARGDSSGISSYGGLVGFNEGSISNCYSTGRVYFHPASTDYLEIDYYSWSEDYTVYLDVDDSTLDAADQTRTENWSFNLGTFENLYCHQETVDIAGVTYYTLENASADGGGLVIESVGYGLIASFVYPLTDVTAINPTVLSTVAYRQYSDVEEESGMNVSVLIRGSDGTVKATLATGIAGITCTLDWYTAVNYGSVSTPFGGLIGEGSTWATKTAAPAAVSYGGASAWTNGDNIFALRGYWETEFWRYNISTNNWTAMTSTPAWVGYGGALEWSGGDNIYAFRGQGNNTFWRYKISTDAWAAVENAPGGVSTGATLVWTGGDNIYAARGWMQKTFWRYTISTGAWAVMTNAPTEFGAGSSLVWSGGDNVYAMTGLGNFFYMYKISTGTWSVVPHVPDTVGDGGSLTWDGGNYIYALRGNYSTDFYRFSIVDNAWETLAHTPSYIGSGGCIAHGGDNHFYVLKGSGTTTFWRYYLALTLNSFWDIQTSWQTQSDGGTGKTTENMKNNRTYTDNTWSTGLTTPWDFAGNPYYDIANENIWDIDATVNDGYPFLTALMSIPELPPTVSNALPVLVFVSLLIGAFFFIKRKGMNPPKHL
jgi:hypothetical protein